MATEQATICSPEDTEPSRPEGACINYADCGNFPPGHPESNNRICDDCLDASRARGRGHDL
ncbi:hypothetical protein HTZ84_09700 [Haloterrigena sp. SYSU A558-1]|uniref:Uncharacterized protein n=1 Tax=Haloterrigena gelatinilytica TaxID=2741724 RepID=A0ABX2L8I7_9EURY|nr:hypothetical protein [Haloterrigena gelatinilytica]NUC72579.1 hypothetical protein [Haloterrigena gelatinilytica]